jgi:hypothetical protein
MALPHVASVVFVVVVVVVMSGSVSCPSGFPVSYAATLLMAWKWRMPKPLVSSCTPSIYKQASPSVSAACHFHDQQPCFKQAAQAITLPATNE